MGDAILEVRDLHARYGAKNVLSGASLDVRRGEIMAILGTSGCGKSTLLKNIVRLHRPTSGVVMLLGHDMTALEEEDLEPVLRNVGVTYQHGALLNSLTAGENVALPLEMHTGMSAALRRQVAEVKLSQVGLAGSYDRYPPELSGGMQKRVAVARAIVMDPEIVFCDEPSAGLDPVTSEGLDQLLLLLNETLGMTIVVVTHELSSIERIADRVTYLDRGKTLFVGTVDEARGSGIPQVVRFFAPGTKTETSHG